MRKSLLAGLFTFLFTPMLLGLSNAWADAGDDALAAFMAGNYSRALQLARPSAEAGDFLAQFTLGRIYEEGKGAPHKRAEAEKWFREALRRAKPAAENGDPRAQFVLGQMYEGLGVAKDEKEAVAWYRKAAAQGNANAQRNLGLKYLHGNGVAKDEKEAVVWVRKAAEQGFAPAQNSLGFMYQQGSGVAKDDNEAVVWVRKAAEQGDAGGQLNLGYMYDEGRGVAKDDKEAVAWYRKAAEQGDDYAQYELGFVYARGRLGVAKDDKEAVAWYRKAAEQGNANGQAQLGFMFASGLGVAKDEKEAFAWYRKAAEQGDDYAQFNLGIMYQQGLGVAKDDKEAFAWYRKAAEQGNANGQAQLGLMFARGLGVAKDKKEAFAWYRKAAEQGNANGQYFLGYMYANGLGVAKDDKEAVAWYRKAAAQGDASAQVSLKIRYRQGADIGTEMKTELFKPQLSQIEIQSRHTPFAQGSQPTPTAPSAVSKEDMRAMFQSLMEEARRSQAHAPKTVYSDVDKPGYATPENPNNFAVVIGVEKYASLPAAEFAERDADAARAHLAALGYPPRNIFFLSGHAATRAKIDQSVNTWLPKRVGNKSTVFFYYSGHGAPDPKTNQAYLVPVDGDAADLDSTAYPIKLLYEKLGKLKARQVIVALDSCFSGAGGRSVLAKGTRPLVGKIDLGGLPDNVIALTASDKSEISGTIADQGHGAFTYYLLKGLEGAAINSSGAVTVQSLYDYLTPKVQDAARLHNRDQTPQLLPAGGERTGIRLR